VFADASDFIPYEQVMGLLFVLKGTNHGWAEVVVTAHVIQAAQSTSRRNACTAVHPGMLAGE